MNGLAYGSGKVGVVISGVELERAHIHRLMAFFANLLQNKRFQREPAMIHTNGYTHSAPLLFI